MVKHYSEKVYQIDGGGADDAQRSNDKFSGSDDKRQRVLGSDEFAGALAA